MGIQARPGPLPREPRCMPSHTPPTPASAHRVAWTHLIQVSPPPQPSLCRKVPAPWGAGGREQLLLPVLTLCRDLTNIKLSRKSQTKNI